MPPMIEILKAKSLKWNEQAHSALKEINLKLTSSLILALLSFSKVFEVECDASRVGMGLSYRRRNG